MFPHPPEDKKKLKKAISVIFPSYRLGEPYPAYPLPNVLRDAGEHYHFIVAK